MPELLTKYARYRIYPTKIQQELINKFFGCTRFVFNHFLKKSRDEYSESGKYFDLYEKQAELTKLKSENIWLYEVCAQSLQFSLECIDAAYRKMSRNRKLGVKSGFPKFKKKVARQAFRCKQHVKVTGGKVFVKKFREGIRINLHQPLEGKIKHVNIIRAASGVYYADFCIVMDIQRLDKVSGRIGIDLNVTANVDSNGVSTINPQPFMSSQVKTRRLRKSLSRKIIGGKNYEKARIKLARAEEKIANQRADHLHKLSRRIINENQVICVEDLCVRDMQRKKTPSKRKVSRRQEATSHTLIADSGWHYLVKMLTYKASWYGRTLVKVNRYYPSSKTCFICKTICEKLPANGRKWTCKTCKARLNRDHNAAQNILHEGLRLLSLV